MASQRPKRRIIPKKLDDDGMHWREEQDILKAMYASIRGYQPPTSANEEEETEKVKPKRKKTYINSKIEKLTTSCNHSPVSTNSTTTNLITSTRTRHTSSLIKTKKFTAAALHTYANNLTKVSEPTKSQSKLTKSTKNRDIKVPQPVKSKIPEFTDQTKQPFKSQAKIPAKREPKVPEPRYPRRTGKTKPKINIPGARIGWPGRKPALVEPSPINGDKDKTELKVRAQRKFAQSLPTTPSTTPVKLFTCGQPEFARACPKTEDFLTFLCLKGSPVLPHDLSFFGSSDSKTAEEPDDGQFNIPGIQAMPAEEDNRDNSKEIVNNSSNPPCLDPVPPPISAIPRKRAPPRLLPMIPFIEKGNSNGLRKVKKERQLKKITRNNHVLKTKAIKNNVIPKHSKHFNNNNHKVLDKNKCAYLDSNRFLNGVLKHKKSKCMFDDVLAVFKQTKNGRISKRRHLLKCQSKQRNNNSVYNVNDKLIEVANLTLPKNGLTHLKDRLKSKTKVNSKTEKISKNTSVNHVIPMDQSEVKIKRKRGRPKRNLDLQLLQTKDASETDEAESEIMGNKLPHGTEISTGHVVPLAKKRRTTSTRLRTTNVTNNKTIVTSPCNRSPKRTRNSTPIHAKVVTTDAPVLYPNQGSWSDPIAYVTAMSEDLDKCGICKVVPPKGWKTDCKLKEDMRFNTEVQYVNRLYHRWNLESRQLACIKRHLKEQGNGMGQPPQVGGCEVDLVRLSQILSEHEGMKSENISKWNKIADILRIPKTVQGRVNKLYKIYCQYLVSFHTLTSEEKLKLNTALEKERTKAHKLGIFNSVDEENCIKGRCVSLHQFCKSAYNTQQMHFKHEPTPTEVEKEYWQAVTEGSQHISVKKAILSTTLSGRHSWHVTNICTNELNLLHCLGNKHSINIPLTKISMLYSTDTWQCNQHALATIDYLHTGAPKIWYCVPASHHEQAKQVIKNEFPQQITSILHPLNNANFKCMVPISSFLKAGIPVYRLVQEAGQFVVTWPGMAIATVSCGYNVAEVVGFATASWLGRGQSAFSIFQDLKESCQFSFEHLLTLVTAQSNLHGNTYLMDQVLAFLMDIRDREVILRRDLADRGMKTAIRFVDQESPARIRDKRSKQVSAVETGDENICCVCKCPCYLSMVVQEKESRIFCLSHGLEAAKKPKICRTLKLMYRYAEDELNTMIVDLQTSMKQAYGKNSLKRRKKKDDKP
ncbi:protein Jumonji-like [Antedon mediterranea]|uniref:protein Jumonji-like n=1 Tax=Antedon mediterranea TaxID=105859 RepID=UPI003AF6AC7A